VLPLVLTLLLGTPDAPPDLGPPPASTVAPMPKPARVEVTLSAPAAETVLTAPPPPEAAPPAAPVAAPVPWLPGEAMDFDIDYLGIGMGKARISVGATEEGVAPVSLESHTAGIGAIVSFRQTLVSKLDVVTLLPVTSVLDAHEPGDYHHTDTARFDRSTGKVSVREQGKHDKTYEVEVPPGTLDFVGLVFRLRTLPLEDGARHEFTVLAGRDVNKVVASVVKREKLKVDAGRFATVKVRVPTGFTGKFSEKNPTFVWFSDDERRVVVRIATDFSVGGATANLKAYRPGG
jgi:Protein of unknown function (DUF3108)